MRFKNSKYVFVNLFCPRAGGIRRMGRVLPGGGWEVAQKVPWTNIS